MFETYYPKDFGLKALSSSMMNFIVNISTRTENFLVACWAVVVFGMGCWSPRELCSCSLEIPIC
jgi:hypothetical protein